MTTAVDLEAYFERIKWGGGAEPNLEVLSGLLNAHLSNIPFENLDILLGRGIRLDLASLQAKLVLARRGGYCFEHATLFAAVLEAVGFQPAARTARVVIFSPEAKSPRTHMFLTVSLPEGEFVLDPGFGPFASRMPIPLRDGSEARGDNETHSMIRDGDRWILRAQLGDKPVDAWVATLDRESPVDFEVSNHFVATHPSSRFVTGILISAFTAEGRVSAMNRDVTVWSRGQPERKQIANRAELRELLNDRFGFDLPEVERLRVPSIPEWQ